MAALVAVVALAIFFLGYRFYARFVGRRIFGDQDEMTTPAHALRDDQDFVPADKHMLWGHHFTSIAGAAPIVGPCIAVFWGWLPALLWVVFGTVFMGAVHDFGALVVSVKERGRSIADVAGTVLTPRARAMFLSFVLVLTWLVLAVFAMVIASQFVSTPSAVLPVQIEILVAIVIGFLIHKKGKKPLIPSLVALGILYLFVWIGTEVPVDLRETFGGRNGAREAWLWMLFGYAAVASLTPVWLLLQPRDFINSHQLMVGLGLLYAGLFVTLPDFDAPLVRAIESDGPSIWPLLFVTIACGAISGFHGLVASGTTSKQINRLRDTRLVGYGGMLGEGTLGLASLLAAAAGIALVGECTLPGQGQVLDLGWLSYYDTWENAKRNTSQAFVLGGGELIHSLGVPSKICTTLMAVLVISFAATTLDTATRIQRFVVAELGDAVGLKPLTNRYVATVIAVVPAILLATIEVPKRGGREGEMTQVAWELWPIFGASNQMMAALTFLVLTLYFLARKKPILPLLIPFVIVTAIALYALFLQITAFIDQENWLLTGIGSLLLGLIVWMLLEGLAACRRLIGAVAETESGDD
ncbi:MAG: carbon starvation protein A [Planctomycetota bacterium]